MVNSFEIELKSANNGFDVYWVPLREVKIDWLDYPWIYYRPFGFALIELGRHEIIVSILYYHFIGGDWDSYVYQGGHCARTLMRESPYAFNSGMATLGFEMGPFYSEEGKLSEEEMAVLEGGHSFIDFDAWFSAKRKIDG